MAQSTTPPSSPPSAPGGPRSPSSPGRGAGAAAPRSARQTRSSAARLAAVQALYVLDIGATETDPAGLSDQARVDQVVRDFLDGAIGGMAIVDVPDPEGLFDPTEEIRELEPPDGALFAQLVRGARAERLRVDEVLQASLSREWPWDRLEAVVRNLLRAGIYELLDRPQTPPRVAIKEYVDIAYAFYQGAEPGMVNAVLDRVARSARPEAFAPRES